MLSADYTIVCREWTGTADVDEFCVRITIL